MPKSKEFIENSDSDNDGESGGAATSKQSKTKGSNSKNDVSSFKTKNSSLIYFSVYISLQLNELKPMIQRMILQHRRLDRMVNDFTK
jgi:hypothetical protein